MTNKVTSWLRLVVVSGILVAIAGLSQSLAYAVPAGYGTGIYGSCVYGTCPITLTSSSIVSLDVLPSAGTKCTIESDAVEVTTDSSTGYNLAIKDGDTSNALEGTSGTIPATSATQSLPAALSTNTWGYRVDSLGSFGSGPTSASSNSAPSGTTFAEIPLSNQTADTLATSSLPASPAVTTTVWYSTCVDSTTTTGTYTDDIIYTALIN